MNMNHETTEFERRAAELLRASAAGLDGATRARLAHARTAALQPAARTPGWLEFRYLAPVGAVAAATLATVLLLSPGKPVAPVNDGTGSALYDMDLLSDAEAFDIAQEPDLGFIEWAAAQGEGTGG
ncbi:MAG TPA: hypothetical protein VMH77_03080 [Steroidobacteraceae bacterium]|nr:hypothetical protein [Steroidobacteraceae bacterium]